MPPKARLFIASAWVLGGSLLSWQLSQIRVGDAWLLIAVALATAIAQSLQVAGATDRSSYNIGLVGYAFAYVHWGPAPALAVILVACVAEWAWQRLPWFIQTFNIAALALAITAASLVDAQVSAGLPDSDVRGLAGVLAAGLTFAIINHALVGCVIYLARGESFSESGVFSRLTLVIDASLLAVGAVAGILYVPSPAASLVALVPLYLIYNTLRIPSLERQAVTDPKTGLFNARYFNDALERELERADRGDRRLTVVVGDLDLLRNINNTYGHLAGDEVLLGVAKILTSSVRGYDIVARIGGEEFAILMTDTSVDQAMTHVEAIREAVESAEITIQTSATPIRITMSFGLAEREMTGQQAIEMLHNADLALYKAKLTGRNRTCLSTDVLEAAEIRTMRAPHHLVPADGFVEAAVSVAVDDSPETIAHQHKTPSRSTDAFVVTVAVVATALASAVLRIPLDINWLGLLAFCVVTLLAEALSVDVYARDAAVSTAVAPFVAGTLLFGPLAAVLLSLTLAGASLVKHHSPWNRFVLNAGVHAIAGIGCIGLAKAANALLPMTDWPADMALSVAGTAIVFATTTWAVAFVIHTTSNEPLIAAWRDRFSWLWPYYGALSIVAFALVYAFNMTGLVGVGVMLVPLMAVRVVQTQYLDRMRTIVAGLRESNAQLERRTQEVSLLSEELLRVLSNVVDLRDPYVLGHSQQVAHYAVLIAEKMGLSSDRIRIIHDAGMLHDVGKLGVPETILAKPDLLTSDEYDLVKKHPSLGARIIGHSHSLAPLVPIVRHHHERYDGSGYPDSLAGKAIPLEARILSVADAAEAMASDRPYRKGLTSAEILAELASGSGTQFDPDAVAAFIAAVGDAPDSVLVNSAQVVRMGTDPRLHRIRRELGALAIEASDMTGN